MKCPDCNAEMKEEFLFTSVTFVCPCTREWLTGQEALELFKPMDMPLSIYAKDVTGPQWGVLVNDLSYFTRGPEGRKFKLAPHFYHYDVG